MLNKILHVQYKIENKFNNASLSITFARKIVQSPKNGAGLIKTWKQNRMPSRFHLH